MFKCFSSLVCMRASSSSSTFSAPWPDPNSPVLSKIDFGVPLVELFKLLNVRDTFLGENGHMRDVAAAVALAGGCKHPDAVWLTSIFEGKDISTEDDAKKVFLSVEDDARALCFAWWLTDEKVREEELTFLLRRAAEMGNAFACSSLCWQVWGENKEKAFYLARFSAAQHERDGYFWLGFCAQYGCGCDGQPNLAKESFLIAAELGDGIAARSYGGLLEEDCPARWLWLSRAASRGQFNCFLDSFSKQVYLFFSGSGSTSVVVFLIGRALRGKVESDKLKIFGCAVNESFIGPANQAVSFYDSQINSARLAVDTWTLVATRLHLIKDMRVYICKIIWEARFEASYKNY